MSMNTPVQTETFMTMSAAMMHTANTKNLLRSFIEGFSLVDQPAPLPSYPDQQLAKFPAQFHRRECLLDPRRANDVRRIGSDLLRRERASKDPHASKR